MMFFTFFCYFESISYFSELQIGKCSEYSFNYDYDNLKGGQMGRSDKVSLWCVSLLINTRLRFFIWE